jgi:hypothetical protein
MGAPPLWARRGVLNDPVLVQEAAADAILIALPDKRPCFREARFKDCFAHIFTPFPVDISGSIGPPGAKRADFGRDQRSMGNMIVTTRWVWAGSEGDGDPLTQSAS